MRFGVQGIGCWSVRFEVYNLLTWVKKLRGVEFPFFLRFGTEEGIEIRVSEEPL